MNFKIAARFALIATFFTFSGCAKNVSHRVDAVKNDQAQFASTLSISPAESASVFVKSSAVSSSANYAGQLAQSIKIIGPENLKKLGYTEFKDSRPEDGLIFFACHQTEPGRSVSVRQSHGLIDVTFRVSGWSRDREECPGRIN